MRSRLPFCLQPSLSRLACCLLLAALACVPALASPLADVAPHLPLPTTLEAVLHALFDQADIIFTGEVTSIEHTPAAVEVHWQVEGAVRGATAGQQFTLREWPGLWQGDSARYVKGQRALLLLHAASAAGFASPVGGPDGVIALRGDNGSGMLDLGLLQQRVLVTDAARLRPAATLQAAGGSLALSDALQQQAAAKQPRVSRAITTVPRSTALLKLAADSDNGTSAPIELGTTQPSSTSTATDTTRNMDAQLVLDMLSAWQRQRGAAR